MYKDGPRPERVKQDNLIESIKFAKLTFVVAPSGEMQLQMDKKLNLAF